MANFTVSTLSLNYSHAVKKRIIWVKQSYLVIKISNSRLNPHTYIKTWKLIKENIFAQQDNSSIEISRHIPDNFSDEKSPNALKSSLCRIFFFKSGLWLNDSYFFRWNLVLRNDIYLIKNIYYWKLDLSA